MSCQYFPDRDALLHEVADAAFAELVRRWEAEPRSAAADQRLREMLVDHVDFALAQPRLYEYMFTERQLLRDDDIWESSLMIAAFLHGLIQLYHGRIGMPEADFRALCLSLGERMINGLRP